MRKNKNWDSNLGIGRGCSCGFKKILRNFGMFAICKWKKIKLQRKPIKENWARPVEESLTMSAKPDFLIIFINKRLIGSCREINPFRRVEVLVSIILNEGWIDVVPINIFWFHLKSYKRRELEMGNWKEKIVKRIVWI